MPQPAHEKETIAIQSNGAMNDIKSLSEDLKTFGLLLFSYRILILNAFAFLG